MRSTLPHLAIIFLLACATEAVAQSTGQRSLHAFVAADEQHKPRTQFSADVAKVYVFWKGQALDVGDKIQATWIAEDVGDVAPKNYKLDEVSMTADGPRAFGTFTITKPNKGWPVGKYRVEIYQNDKLAETVKFEVSK